MAAATFSFGNVARDYPEYLDELGRYTKYGAMGLLTGPSSLRDAYAALTEVIAMKVAKLYQAPAPLPVSTVVPSLWRWA